jgi:hypothetical protein
VLTSLEVLDTSFQNEFGAAKSIPWVTAGRGTLAGAVRSAGGKDLLLGTSRSSQSSRLGLFSIFYLFAIRSFTHFRHMVPFDQPEAALVIIDILLC